MFNIQFNFNPVTSEVTDLVVTNLDEKIGDGIIKVEDNKLVLSREALVMLNAKSGDRVTINYYNINPELTFPIIARSEILDGPGNKITKSNSVLYKGQQREILLQYGKLFKLEPFKKYFKLVPIEAFEEIDDLREEESDLEQLFF